MTEKNRIMKKIDIHVPAYSKKYPVIIGENMLSTITNHVTFDDYSSVFIFTDSHVAPHYLHVLTDALAETFDTTIHHTTFAAGEKSKNLDTVHNAYTALIQAKADRCTLMINLGGGVVSDMGGYIASTYLRGIPYINIPTTLEAMVDASVGGKTGVNVDSLKNYIGVFSTPEAVIIDVDTIKTLPERTFIQGYAEVIKHGLIKDAAYFEKVTKKMPAEYSQDELIDIIQGSVGIKADIVQQDPHEKGIRKILNFGHTIGHVIESVSLQTETPLFHGEAVAIGIVAEAYISRQEGMISEDDYKQVESAIKTSGLPVRFKTNKHPDELVEMLYTDKKTEKGSIKWSLLAGIGKAEFNIVVNERFAREGIVHTLQT